MKNLIILSLLLITGCSKEICSGQISGNFNYLVGKNATFTTLHVTCPDHVTSPIMQIDGAGGSTLGYARHSLFINTQGGGNGIVCVGDSGYFLKFNTVQLVGPPRLTFYVDGAGLIMTDQYSAVPPADPVNPYGYLLINVSGTVYKIKLYQ
jgi:hypothetical protein